jgi:Na+/H+-dicarboxylate symporter
MFRQMPFVLALLIVVIVLLGHLIPTSVATILFGLSLSIKSLIIFLLPVVIFSLLYKASVKLANDASRTIVLILLGVIVSNFFTTTLSQFVGFWVYGFDLSIVMPKASEGLQAEALLQLPTLMPNSMAMFAGIISGIILVKIAPKQAENIALILEKVVEKILRFITLLIPFFVTGFVIKLQADGVMIQIVKNYTLIFAIIGAASFGYIMFLYAMMNRFKVKSSLLAIKNMLPAAFSGFSTMSSAASMPLSIMGTERNVRHKDLAHTVVPATVNIHLIGDCVAIPCFAFAILKNYGLAQPDFMHYFIFTVYFVLAKFSVAAIPGGGIIVMLPILEQYLGFNSEMLSLITALYILFDPVITSANVMGNGAFAVVLDRVVGKSGS